MAEDDLTDAGASDKITHSWGRGIGSCPAMPEWGGYRLGEAFTRRAMATPSSNRTC